MITEFWKDKSFFDFSKIHPNHRYSLLTDLDKLTLHSVVKTLPENSIILEVGTFVGGSASIMAHANSKVEIHSFDLFDNRFYDKKQKNIFQNFLNSDLRKVELVKNVLEKDFNNIFLYKKCSPFNCEFWNKPIDLYFEDGEHTNPVLSYNINFWKKWIKLNGILILHDYRPNLNDTDIRKYIDVIDTVNTLTKNHEFKFIIHIGDMAILQKIKN